ncbi:MAG: VTT domain-containing protein [Caldilineaceae bacterium]|nr:VTT domain-containing protein [Caldilineaceae bacterium]
MNDFLLELSNFLGRFVQGDGLWLHQIQMIQWGNWSYLLLALLVAIEGPIATLLGAAAAASGVLQLPWVFLAASAGNIGADVFWYGLGRVGKVEDIARYGRWIGLKAEAVQRLEVGMRQNAARILLIAKLTAGLVIPALIAAGLVRAPWRKWFLPVFAGEMIWTGALVLGGYYATAYLARIERGVTYAVAGGSLLALAFLAFKLRGLWRSQHASAPPPEQPKTGKSV